MVSQLSLFTCGHFFSTSSCFLRFLHNLRAAMDPLDMLLGCSSEFGGVNGDNSFPKHLRFHKQCFDDFGFEFRYITCRWQKKEKWNHESLAFKAMMIR